MVSWFLQRSCEQEIEWYQSVKETQGSAEETSFGQMRNINRDGCYTIGSREKTIHTSPSQLIKMNVREREKVLPKYIYTLDDLSDLESKLVLITGRESTEREEVEQFLLVRFIVYTHSR